MFRSIFTDELSKDVDESLPAIKAWGSDYVDFRALVNGKPIENQSAEELKNLKALVQRTGLKVGAIQSSLCKVNLPDKERQKQELDKLEGLIRACDALGCRLVRSFNYWQPWPESGEEKLVKDPALMAQVMDMFAPVAKRAKEAGLILAFENCGQTADEVIALLKALDVPEWGMAWDSHNDFELLPLNPETASDYYERCLNYTLMLHVKATTILPELEGFKLPWGRILKGALATGKDMPVSIETHNPKGSPLTNEEATHKTFDYIGNLWPKVKPASIREAVAVEKQYIRTYANDPVRFVVVGLGMGSHRSMQLTQTPGCKLYGVVDINGEKAKSVGEKLGVPWSEDINTFLKDPAVEVMYVVTPTGKHALVAEQCLLAGKHVLCTKPMDANAANCRALIETAKKSGRLLGIDFDLRQDEFNLSLKKAMDSGWFGRSLYINSSLYVQRLDPYFKENGGWRGTWEFDGGGAMCNQGVHEVDRLQFIAGMPKQVRAVTKTQTHKIEVEDIGMGEWDYGGDQLLRFCATTSHPMPVWYVRIEIHGTEGAFVHSSGGPEGNGSWYGKDGVWTQQAPYPVERQWLQGSDAFASAVRVGTPVLAPGEEGLKSRVLLDAMYESARNNGAWIKI
jgi:predicted dehydrogenase/sugar phosphate isomerase/epimerase